MKLNFLPSVPRELRQYLRQNLRDYEAKMPMSDDERHMLYDWVSKGNDVSCNPSNLAFESGCEMDFLSGLRANDEWADSIAFMPS